MKETITTLAEKTFNPSVINSEYKHTLRISFKDRWGNYDDNIDIDFKKIGRKENIYALAIIQDIRNNTSDISAKLLADNVDDFYDISGVKKILEKSEIWNKVVANNASTYRNFHQYILKEIKNGYSRDIEGFNILQEIKKLSKAKNNKEAIRWLVREDIKPVTLKKNTYKTIVKGKFYKCSKTNNVYYYLGHHSQYSSGHVHFESTRHYDDPSVVYSNGFYVQNCSVEYESRHRSNKPMYLFVEASDIKKFIKMYNENYQDIYDSLKILNKSKTTEMFIGNLEEEKFKDDNDVVNFIVKADDVFIKGFDMSLTEVELLPLEVFKETYLTDTFSFAGNEHSITSSKFSTTRDWNDNKLLYIYYWNNRLRTSSDTWLMEDYVSIYNDTKPFKSMTFVTKGGFKFKEESYLYRGK